jgi:hypothetical protein
VSAADAYDGHMRSGVGVLLLGCLIACSISCSKANPHTPGPPPTTDEPRTVEPADAAPAMTPVVIDAPPPVDAAIAAPPDAALAQSVKYEEAEGVGTCQQDSDCVLSSWQSGCCLNKCEGYAINKKDLAAEISKENCPPPGTHLCPPPAPCPLQKRRAIEAKCRKHRCTASFQKLP